MNEVQADAVTGGTTDSKSAEIPERVSAEMFGK
jgi:hypothetical protein